MKNYLFLLMLISSIFESISVFAQAPLIFQDLNAINRDVQYITDSALVIIGDHGKIIRTDNGGKSWKWQECYRRADLKRLHFRTSQLGYIVGDSGLVLHTSNGGIVWNNRYLPTAWCGGVYTVSESVAVVVGAKGSIFRTDDAGKTWTQVYADTSFNLNDVQFTDELFGTAVGSNGAMLRSVDGGLTWKSLYKEPLLELTRVRFVNQRYGYAVGGSIRYADTTRLYYLMHILRTTDGGSTWVQQADTSDIHILLGLSALDTINAVVTGNGCRIFHTNNSGNKWKQDTLDFSAYIANVINYPSLLYLSGVSFLNSERAVLVGMDNVIAFTTNKAETWKLTSYARITVYISANKNVSDIKFSSGDSGVVLSNAAVVWQTTDAGVTSLRRFPLVTDGKGGIITSASLWAGVHFTSPMNGIAIGVDPEGTITGLLTIRTTDAGKTWVRANEIKAYTMSFPTALRGYVGGPSRVVGRTDDGGETWDPLNYPGWTAKCQPFLSADTGFIISSQVKQTDNLLQYPSGYVYIAKIYHTSDGGATFNEVLVDSSYSYFNSVYPRDNTTIFCVGDLNGKMARSNDCGLTWKWVTLPTKTEITRIYFHTSRLGFMTDTDNNVLMSTDGGDSWQVYPIPFYKYYEGEPNSGWYNYIIKGNNDSTIYLTGINRFTRCIIPRNILSGVDAPHTSEGTFNPYFYIKTQPIPATNMMEVTLYGLYSVKNQSLTVKVYNMLGMEVADFSREANAVSTGSTSTFNADVGNLSGGVYVLQYSAGGYTKSGLFVVAR
jgi:photosystem II stability/assembly factor-like uncharacterized protein